MGPLLIKFGFFPTRAFATNIFQLNALLSLELDVLIKQKWKLCFWGVRSGFSLFLLCPIHWEGEKSMRVMS